MTSVTYLPTDEESAEGIGSWTVETPAAHDDLTRADVVLAAFEADRAARLSASYARLRSQGGTYGHLNGAIGSTRIPPRVVEGVL